MVKFRTVKEEDRAEIDAWIASDPGHVGKMTADFFIRIPLTSIACVLEDDKGPAMYVRFDDEGRSTRAHIQFAPDRRRIVRALEEGYPAVAQTMKARGFHAIIFDSCSPALMKWMAGFGFTFEGRAAL